MAENIGGPNPFSSGGHRWLWAAQPLAEKRIGVVGTEGEGRIVTHLGARPGVVRGILKATGETRAEADTALDVLEAVLEALKKSGDESAWEDDQGHTGSNLVVADYVRQGGRDYGRTPTPGWAVWQTFECRVLELAGKP